MTDKQTDTIWRMEAISEASETRIEVVARGEGFAIGVNAKSDHQESSWLILHPEQIDFLIDSLPAARSMVNRHLEQAAFEARLPDPFADLYADAPERAESEAPADTAEAGKGAAPEIKRKRHGSPWTEEETEELIEAHRSGTDVEAISKNMGRSQRAVEMQLRRLGVRA